MYNEKKDKFVKMPVYEGGQEALKQFINNNLKYPIEALKLKIEGTIQVFFIIGNKGKVMEAKALNSLGYGCDEEAVRVIKLLEFKVPKTHNVKASFNKKINIHFNLANENIKENHNIPTQDQNFQVQYSITSTKITKSENQEKQKSIEYTILLNQEK